MATATPAPSALVAVEELYKPPRLDVFARLPWLKRLVRMRSFQFLVILPNLFMFYLFLIAGLWGTPVGNRNIIIVFVWILWWFVLITLMMPFGSRIWCTICPLPFFGDWLQRRAVIKVRPGKSPGTENTFFGLHKRWPKRLSNIWLQNFGFLFLATFSALLVTRPIVSAAVFSILFLIATGLALVYRLRTFCSYVCPISGFLSLYAMTSTVELRSVDKDTCLKCQSKACIRGSERGWACPWNVYMGKLDRNNYCGLCWECVKSCPNDNISLFARPFSTSDVALRGYDEVWKACIMLVLALSYSAMLLGPWGRFKDWANVSEVRDWGGFGLFAAGQALLALVIFPGLYYLSIRLAKWYARADTVPTKELFLKYAYMLVPMGLLAWIAFSVPLIMVNGSYIISVASDPLGWGMNLFGTADFPWRPLWPEWVPFLQVPLLLAGFYYGLRSLHKVGSQLFSDPRQLHRSLLPPAVLLLGVSVVFLKLFVGDAMARTMTWREAVGVLAVLLVLVGLPLLLWYWRAVALGHRYPPDTKVITLTANASGGIWTQEEIVGSNYWRIKPKRAEEIPLNQGDHMVLRLRSVDVLHSFAIPLLHLGPVEVPAGHTVELAFTPDRAGVLTFLCWQVCSPDHAKLRGRFVVKGSKAEETW